MATQTCGTCNAVTTVAGEGGWDEIFVAVCSSCAHPGEAELFEHLSDLEFQARHELASEAFGSLDARARARGNRKAVQAELYATLDAMTPDQMRRYGAYRAG